MIHHFRRSVDTRSCETRSGPDGHGYELVVTDRGGSHVERFTDPRALTNRQCELRYDWLMRGWREAGPGDEPDDE